MTDHYFTAEPAAARAPRTVRLVLRDLRRELATDAGVFSPSAIDAGTLVLLESVPAPGGGDVLDLGCGYGPVAAALTARAPEATVWAVDVNERALALCRRNVPGARAVLPAEVPPDVRFSTIWSNPPIKVGKAALHDMLLAWLPRLTPDGRAHLVVQKHLGADSLHRWLLDEGFVAGRLTSKRGYRVLTVEGRP